METESTQEKKVPLLKRLRNAVFPIKETDGSVVKLGKNVGFAVFMILFVCVSFSIVIAISLAL